MKKYHDFGTVRGSAALSFLKVNPNWAINMRFGENICEACSINLEKQCSG